MHFSRLAGFALLLLPLTIAAQDWPQWRGPHRDGTAPQAKLPAAWPQPLAKPAYDLPVGEGHASPVYAQGRLFLFTREKEAEVVRCLDVASGKEQWQFTYAAPYQMDPAAFGHGKGPKATPTYADGKVYTQGMAGQLHCLDVATGREVWKKDLAKEYATTGPQYGTSASILIEGDLAITLTGGRKEGMVVAFDRNTGQEKWKTPCDGPAYQAPYVAMVHGVRQILTFTRREFLSLSPADGKILWRLPYVTDYEQNIVMPVVWKDMVILSGFAKKSQAFRITKAGDTWKTEEVWKADKLRMYMSSPVLAGDHLFAHDQNGFITCVEAATGKTLWSKGRFREYVSMILVGQQLLCLDTEGNLLVLAADPKEYRELARYKVSTSPVWAHLCLAPGRLIVKDKTNVRCYVLEPGQGS
jgi:outer membrane protein assembly factor BamB